MSLLAGVVANLQLIRADERRAVGAVPVGHRLVVFRRLVLSAVLEADDGAVAEGHQVGEQETIGGFNPVLVVECLLCVAGPDGVAGERESHVPAAPVVAPAAPFLRARSVSLRGLAVV